MKKYAVELDKDQLRIIISALEDANKYYHWSPNVMASRLTKRLKTIMEPKETMKRETGK